MKNKTFAGILLIITCLSACVNVKKPGADAGTSNLYPTLPAGWSPLDSANGVILGIKHYNRNSVDTTDYVIIANLGIASIRLLDSLYDTQDSVSVLNRFSVTDTGTSFWTLYHSSNSFAMANLSFFENSNDTSATAPLCYPLWYKGTYISNGCSNPAFCNVCYSNQPYQQRIVLLFNSGMQVMDYPDTVSFNNYPIPDSAIAAFVGNAPVNVPRSPDSYVARTYIARQGSNLVLYTSTNAREVDIYNVLQKEFMADSTDIVMFDGGGSTQMICNGKTCISSSDHTTVFGRKVPSAIEIRAGKAQ